MWDLIGITALAVIGLIVAAIVNSSAATRSPSWSFEVDLFSRICPSLVVPATTHRWRFRPQGGINDGRLLTILPTAMDIAHQRTWVGCESRFPPQAQELEFRFWGRIPGSHAAQAAPNPNRTGQVLQEVWDGIPGVNVVDLTTSPDYPNSPSSRTLLTELRGPTNWSTDYGSRSEGLLIAPVTGTYTMWIASDDQGEFWMSPEDTPGGLTLVCSIPAGGWTNPQQYTKFPSQSGTVDLQEGKAYYYRLLHKEGTGGDNWSVRWDIPAPLSITEDPIPGFRVRLPSAFRDDTNLTFTDVWLQDLGTLDAPTNPALPPVMKPVPDPDFQTTALRWLARLGPTRSNGYEDEGTYDSGAQSSSWRPFNLRVEPSYWRGRRFRLWFAFTPGRPMTYVRGIPEISGELSLYSYS